jgi:hypothetical protein
MAGPLVQHHFFDRGIDGTLSGVDGADDPDQIVGERLL